MLQHLHCTNYSLSYISLTLPIIFLTTGKSNFLWLRMYVKLSEVKIDSILLTEKLLHLWLQIRQFLHNTFQAIFTNIIL